MKRLDVILIPIIIILSIIPLIYSSGEKSSIVRISSNNKIFDYDITKDRVINIPGTLGDTVVEIKNKKVRILNSPCPNHTCMRSSISRYPESLVCLPNDVIIQIEGEGETDALTF